ncbi:hypothetical protein GGI24_001292 [Coemansia furcata]|nr:hypothetical protein GGI24_001292 [Coemansia furcata]
MAPGRPRRPSSSSSHAPSNGARRTFLRRPSSESALTDLRGLPEYLYQAYERLPEFTAAPNHPLLVDAGSGHELTYSQFQSLAAVLATSMLSRLAIGVGDTVALYSTPNIDTPVVSVAAWLIGASVVAIPPETNADELDFIISRLHALRALFVTRALLPAVVQVFAPRRTSLYQSPIVVVVDATIQVPTPPINVTLQDLYTPQPGEVPLERASLTRNEAQGHIAVIYNIFTRNDIGQVVGVDLTHLSHDAVINNYNDSNLQRQTPPSLLERRPLPLTYSVPRLHFAFYLHRIVFDIFCRGGRYLVSSAFDPAEFVVIVHYYQLEFAELVSAELERLIAYLSTRDSNQRQIPSSSSGPGPGPLHNLSIPEMLAPLRFIYTPAYTPDQASSLSELLPHVVLVRTRYGSYLEPPDQPRGS